MKPDGTMTPAQRRQRMIELAVRSNDIMRYVVSDLRRHAKRYYIDPDGWMKQRAPKREHNATELAELAKHIDYAIDKLYALHSVVTEAKVAAARQEANHGS